MTKQDEFRGSTPLWPGAVPMPDGVEPARPPAYTPFLVQTVDMHPCLVVCPGGGYGRKAMHEAIPVAHWLNALGVSALVLDYRVAPHRHPAPLTDAQRLIRLARHNAAEWDIDPKRIGILGFSAGGHLAAAASTLFDGGDPAAEDPVERQSSRPDASILCYPVITFGEHRHDGSMRNLLGKRPLPRLRIDLSLESRVTPETPPTFLWHTADDSAVPVENALLYARACHANRVPFALHVFPEGRHGLGLAEERADVREWTRLCHEWLAHIRFLR